jgi:hypothetical protein
MWMLRWSRLLLALVVCVAALGCGGSAGKGGGGSPAQQSDAAATDAAAQQSNGTPGSPGGSPQGQAGGAPGAPGAAGSGNRGNVSQAIGAPVKIPAFTEVGQGLLDDLHQRIKDAIQEGCKPRPADCIPTVVKQRPGTESSPDCFEGTDPDTNTPNTPDGKVALDPRKVQVLVVYSGSNPDGYSCKLQEESSSESNVDQQPTDNTTAPTDTSQQPTDTTASTDTSQPEPPSS